jgi:hypothetical protein
MHPWLRKALSTIFRRFSLDWNAGRNAVMPERRIDVRPVHTSRDLWRFIDVPDALNRDDPAWIAPLRCERRLHLSRHNPYFEHGMWQAWVAWRNGRPVGRISAQVDRLHRERYGPDTGQFGLLEAVDDPVVFAGLFGAAEAWLIAQGVRAVTGPFNLSINQECGLLVEGFAHPPVVMMPHGRPWYDTRVQALGYVPAKDLLAYRVRTDFTPPRVMDSLVRRYGSAVRMRTLRRDRMAAELEILRELFNDAWSGNWGFVPFTRAEFADIGATLRLLVPDEFVWIAELADEPVAFIAALPNVNEAIAGLHGRLLPFGWAKLLWRLKVRGVRTGRVPLMGVRRRFQNSPLGIALAFLVIRDVKAALHRHGIGEVEMSWILEDNKGMRHILDVIGSELYKRYRIYARTLPAPAAART